MWAEPLDIPNHVPVSHLSELMLSLEFTVPGGRVLPTAFAEAPRVRSGWRCRRHWCRHRGCPSIRSAAPGRLSSSPLHFPIPRLNKQTNKQANLNTHGHPPSTISAMYSKFLLDTITFPFHSVWTSNLISIYFLPTEFENLPSSERYLVVYRIFLSSSYHFIDLLGSSFLSWSCITSLIYFTFKLTA